MLRGSLQPAKLLPGMGSCSNVASSSRTVHNAPAAIRTSSLPAPQITKQQFKNRQRERDELKNRVREMTEPNPVLGYVPNEEGEKFWKSSDLYKVLLSKDQVWGVREDRRGNLVKIDDEGQRQDASVLGPKRMNFNLESLESRTLLFSDLPEVNSQDEVQRNGLAEELDDRSISEIELIEEEEIGKVDQLRRILDLRNASGKGIQVENTRRIINHFGTRNPNDRRGPDSGSVEVQAAILTYRIRNLYEHLQEGHRHDNHNRRAMTLLVHQRARLLKYLKRQSLSRYEALLPRLGLQRRAVEGEIVVGGKPRMQIGS